MKPWYHLLFVLLDESSLPVVATEAVLLVSSGSGGNQENDPCSDDLGEFSISRVINRQFSGTQNFTPLTLGYHVSMATNILSSVLQQFSIVTTYST